MNRRAQESGQTLVVFVLFMIVCLSFIGVVVDGGMFLFERREMQGVADAAALASVRELPGSPTDASTKAHEYVESQNGGANGTLTSVAITDSNRQVRVHVQKTGTASFSELLGMSAPDIGASASARVQMMGPRPGMLPMAFMRDSFSIGQSYEIKFDSNATGNRGAIAPDMLPGCAAARGASDFTSLIKGSQYGGVDACATPIAETLDTEPGQMAGPTKSGFDARLAGNTDGFSDIFGTDPQTGLQVINKTNSPRIGIVPVIEQINGTNTWPAGRSEPVRVLAYMIVYIGHPTLTGHPAYTNGGKSVWVTPVRPILPSDFTDGGFVDWNSSLPAPVVFRLTD